LKWTKTLVRTENGLEVTYKSNRPLTPDERKSFGPIEFTPAERAEIKHRQHVGTQVIDRVATTETLEQQEQLADELVPRFDASIRVRNQIKARLARAPRLVAVIRPRPRGRRAQASRSSAKSGDSPSDPDLDEPPGRRWAHPQGVAA
jgi:hypothetical protein